MQMDTAGDERTQMFFLQLAIYTTKLKAVLRMVVLLRGSSAAESVYLLEHISLVIVKLFFLDDGALLRRASLSHQIHYLLILTNSNQHLLPLSDIYLAF